MAVTKRLRYEILRRDNNTCRYCGGSAPDVKMTVDHVTPVSLGGSDDPSNLVAACSDCNAGKSATPPTADLVADVAQANLRWADAMKLAAHKQSEEAERDRRKRLEMIDDFEGQWTAFWLEDPDANDTSTRYRYPGRRYAPRPDDWVGSIERMLNAGLTMQDICEAARIALRKSHVVWDEMWVYFCGTAWGILRERQRVAIELLESGQV